MVHQCYRNGWQICSACQGRIHHQGCRTARLKDKDCCPARHKMLHEQGHEFGLDDAAVKMWDANTVYHTLREWGK